MVEGESRPLANAPLSSQCFSSLCSFICFSFLPIGWSHLDKCSRRASTFDGAGAETDASPMVVITNQRKGTAGQGARHNCCLNHSALFSIERQLVASTLFFISPYLPLPYLV